MHEYSHKKINIYQDQEIIRNVVLNLISNALKYSYDGTIVKVKSSVEGSTFCLMIEDQGKGIPLAEQKYLFNRFFRASNITATQGTGLGLNIVKRYLELIDGSISFKSIENEGTSFTIKFPLEIIDENNSTY